MPTLMDKTVRMYCRGNASRQCRSLTIKRSTKSTYWSIYQLSSDKGHPCELDQGWRLVSTPRCLDCVPGPQPQECQPKSRHPAARTIGVVNVAEKKIELLTIPPRVNFIEISKCHLISRETFSKINFKHNNLCVWGESQSSAWSSLRASSTKAHSESSTHSLDGLIIQRPNNWNRTTCLE